MTQRYKDADLGLLDSWDKSTVRDNGGRSYSRTLCPERSADEGYILITPKDTECLDRHTDDGWIATQYFEQSIVEHEGRWDADGNADCDGKFDCDGNEIEDIPPRVVVEHASCPMEAVVLLLKAGYDFESVGANDAMCGDNREFILVREQNADELECLYIPGDGKAEWRQTRMVGDDDFHIAVMPYDDANSALERAYCMTLGFTYYLIDVSDKDYKARKEMQCQ